MIRNDTVWQTAALAKTYLEGVRGAIPLASAQIDVILRIVQKVKPQVKSFLDLGCGDGILGSAILTRYPHAKGVFLDFSESMIAAAKSKLGGNKNLKFIVQDFGLTEWVEVFKNQDKFDVIVSGFSIHHQPDTRKKEIYTEIYNLLQPGGVFLNLEHVSSPSKLIAEVFEESFVDALYTFHQNKGSNQTKAEIAQAYYNRADKGANILAPVETQCDWLREIGFIHVDCYMKHFELAIFGGIHPR